MTKVRDYDVTSLLQHDVICSMSLSRLRDPIPRSTLRHSHSTPTSQQPPSLPSPLSRSTQGRQIWHPNCVRLAPNGQIRDFFRSDVTVSKVIENWS